MKAVVFDIDGTLLHRTSKKIQNYKYDGIANDRYLYYRPHLQALAQHFSRKDLTYTPILWTSMRRQNATPIQELFNKVFGLNFDRLYTQEQCSTNLSKDLKIVAKDYDISVEKVLLIDDSPHKRIDSQNFMQVKSYQDIDSNDQEIIRVVTELQKICHMQPSDKSKYMHKTTTPLHSLEPILNPKLKVIVFDMHKTLFSKYKVPIANSQAIHKIKGQHIYLRPNIQAISFFNSIHVEFPVKLVVWTSISSKSTAQKYLQLFQSCGFPFGQIFNGNDCQEGVRKDLKTICKKYGCLLTNVILVDDSPYKSAEGQNYIHIQPFTGEKQDYELIRVMKQLDKFIGCDDDCQIKKLQQHSLPQWPQLRKQQLINKLNNKSKHPKKSMEKKIIMDKAEESTKVEDTPIFNNPNLIQKTDRILPDYRIRSYLMSDFLPIRCLVFDLNETLLNRQTDKVLGVQPDCKFKQSKNRSFYNYVRPNISQVANFFNKTPHIKKVLWTTIRLQNCKHMKVLLQQRNLHFDAMFTQENLVEGRKDLSIVAQYFSYKPQEILLIDDNLEKRVENQNFTHLRAFNPADQNDDILCYLVKELSQLIFTDKREQQHQQKHEKSPEK